MTSDRRIRRRLTRAVTGLSLRARVLLIAIALLAVGLMVGSVVTTSLLREYLVGRVDASLRPAAEKAAQLARLFGPEVSSAVDGREGARVGYIAYLDNDGVIVTELRLDDTPDLADPRLPRLDRGTVEEHAGSIINVPSEDGTTEWRVLALPHTAERVKVVGGQAQRDEGVVVVAASLEEVDVTITRLRAISLTTAITLLLALAVTGWFAVRAGMRPLRQIEETAAAVAAGDLSRRIPQQSSPGTEIGRLTTALNSMLAQNEAAFTARARSEAQMRRFVADASHELRTPLVGIRGFTKLYRMGGLPDADQTMARIEKESERLTGLVEDLLLLAHLDEPDSEAATLQRAPMDLRTLAAEALHDVRALDPDRPVELTGPCAGRPPAGPPARSSAGPSAGPPSPALAFADESRMRQVVTNLVGNAIVHTPSGSPIRIGVGTVDGRAVLEVADQGPGLTAEQAGRVFDRFFRADDSRSRVEGGGAGLGLAIVHSLVTAHGGDIELTTAPGEGATFRVTLPPPPPRPEKADD